MRREGRDEERRGQKKEELVAPKNMLIARLEDAADLGAGPWSARLSSDSRRTRARLAGLSGVWAAGFDTRRSGRARLLEWPTVARPASTARPGYDRRDEHRRDHHHAQVPLFATMSDRS